MKWAEFYGEKGSHGYVEVSVYDSIDDYPETFHTAEGLRELRDELDEMIRVMEEIEE